MRLSRSGFETIPSDLSKAELFRYFTYSAEDRFAIFECRGNNNKVGFALLLGSVRLTGRFPIHFDLLPGSLLAHVCKQLNIAGLLFLDYPQRPATLHQHKEKDDRRDHDHGSCHHQPLVHVVGAVHRQKAQRGSEVFLAL